MKKILNYVSQSIYDFRTDGSVPLCLKCFGQTKPNLPCLLAFCIRHAIESEFDLHLTLESTFRLVSSPEPKAHKVSL